MKTYFYPPSRNLMLIVLEEILLTVDSEHGGAASPGELIRPESADCYHEGKREHEHIETN